jgi:hypothetical protein
MAEFPTVEVARGGIVGICDAIIDGRDWMASTSFAPFDDAVRAASSETVSLRAPAESLDAIAWQVLTRYQRLIGRRNASSRGRTFDATLRALGGSSTHDIGLDTWQWLLRLDDGASLTLQLAALLRWEDIAVAYDLLRLAGVAIGTAGDVRDVLCDRPADALLRDAAALSFLSLASEEYVDTFGSLRARRKIADTFMQTSRAARAKLAQTHLRPDVFHYLCESAAA